MTEVAQVPVEKGFADPTRRVTGGWIALFATAWLGIWMAQLTPVQLLLPMQVEARIDATAWQDKVIAFGIISGIAGVFALVAYPLTGALSDRTFAMMVVMALAGHCFSRVHLSFWDISTALSGSGSGGQPRWSASACSPRR